MLCRTGRGSDDRLLLERRKNHALITDVDGDAGADVDLVASASRGKAIAFCGRHFSEVVRTVRTGGGGTGESQCGVTERAAHAGKRMAGGFVHSPITHGVLRSRKCRAR